MLVKFHSSSSGELMMFAESARTLLGLLGKECTARGVFMVDELPGAIAALRAAMNRRRGEAPAKDVDAGAEDLPVGFVQRATPFVELLERTLADEGHIVWQAPADFGAG